MYPMRNVMCTIRKILEQLFAVGSVLTINHKVWRTSPFEKRVSSHEKEILKFFGASECFVDEPDRRFDEFAGFLILFTNRSGSNAIAEDIAKLPQCGHARETLNSSMVLRKSREQGFSAFSDYIYYVCKDQNSLTPGIKVSIDQLLFLYESGLLKYCLSRFKIISIQRRDVLSQAVSFFIANTTKQWKSSQSPVAREPDFDAEKILSIMKAISSQNAKMHGFLSLLGTKYHEVVYEDYFADPVGSLEDISQFLGIQENNFNFYDDKRKLKKQASAINTDYIDRVRYLYGIYD